MVKLHINPNRLKSRDPLMVSIINGATKAAVHVDRRKLQNRKACRGRTWLKENV